MRIDAARHHEASARIDCLGVAISVEILAEGDDQCR